MDREESLILSEEEIYCTILTKSRVYQGLALLESLKNVSPYTFYLYILCLDADTYQLFQKINDPAVVLLTETILEEKIVQLKKHRKMHEYCWTLKPVLIERLLLNNPTMKRVTYLDCDLYFWQNPSIIYASYPNFSVLLSEEEKYNPNWKKSKVRKLTKITGKYNSGFISFKQDKRSLQCVTWWKSQCIKRCEINPKEGVFGDQKYLDQLPDLFPSVCSITMPGVNTGPWNYLKYHFSVKDGDIYIDGNCLIFYHFSSFRVKGKNKFKLLNKKKNQEIPFIYPLYKTQLKKMMKFVQKIDPDFSIEASPEDLKKYW